MRNGEFRKSSFCGTSDGPCVEVGMRDGMIAVRDSKDPDSPELLFTDDEWNVFVRGAKAGEFDLR